MPAKEPQVRPDKIHHTPNSFHKSSGTSHIHGANANANAHPPRTSDQVGRLDSSLEWSQSDEADSRAASMEVNLQPQPHSQSLSPVPDLSTSNASTREPIPSRPVSSRLSRLKLKQSDVHLSVNPKQDQDEQTPVPAMPTPEIISTAPTLEVQQNRPGLTRKRSRLLPFGKSRPMPDDRDNEGRKSDQIDRATGRPSPEKKKMKFPSLRTTPKDPFSDLVKQAGNRLESEKQIDSPNGSSLSIPGRPSSQNGDGNMDSSRENVSTAEENGRTSEGRPSGTFTWLSRKQKNRKSLFPLPDKTSQKSQTAPPTAAASPRPSTSARHSDGPARPSGPPKAGSQRNLRGTYQTPQSGSGTPANSSSITFAPHPAMLRSSSTRSNGSDQSSPSTLAPPDSKLRERSSTLGSNSGGSDGTPPTPPFVNDISGRNSTSTVGRSSLSNLFGLNRFRQGDPSSPRQSSTANGVVGGSLSNSVVLNREPSLPEREEGEPALQYLDRVEDMAHRSIIPSILSKSGDEFLHTVMRSFMRKFAYFGDPLDMAIRKLLMEIDLPKETQQIDRVLQSFADRYHECNPGIFNTSGEAYFIAFSILMLQTDFFNKNNKRKMTKQDYVKNSSIEGISNDVLECFYDNIIYTPFIRVEDDQDIVTMRTRKANRKTAKAAKAAKAAIKAVPSETARRDPKQPLDPYTLIFESRLDTLRPPLKEILTLDDPYSYLGTLPIFDRRVLRNSKIGIIQIESARSRPDAFMSQSGIEDPSQARVGLVDLPIDKVGVLWRKDPKKKTARSPWQEWGAVLTGAGLYFFKNAGWVKNYVHQYEGHLKHGGAGTMCFFKPPITTFKPDYMLPTDHGVALQDSTYKRHKNAFTFFGHNGSEEVFLADRDSELNDWLAKLNHQAACKTAGIRQRGLVGGQYDGQRQRGMRRLESSNTTATNQTIQTATGDVTIQRGTIDQGLAQQISAARRIQVQQKLAEGQEKLDSQTKTLEDSLRDSRHLLIMAPIQQKTCEFLVLAANKAQETLRTQRIDWWKISCHQDILTLDLEEEQREAERWQARIDMLSPTTRGMSSFDTDGDADLSRVESNTSSDSANTAPKDPATFQSSKHALRASDGVELATSADLESFHTPPEATPAQATPPQTPLISANSPHASTASPHGKSPSVQGHRMSTLSAYSHTSHFQPRAPRPSLDIPGSSTDAGSIADRTDDEDDETAIVSDANESMKANNDETRPKTPKSPENRHEAIERRPSSSKGTPSDRGRTRRVSIQRALKEGSEHVLGHTRQASRKVSNKDGKDDAASPHGDGARFSPGGSSLNSNHPHRSKSDKKSDEGVSSLVRERPSFTVHGKKASVVTIGGDWTVNPEETLQRIKAAASPLSPNAAGKDKEFTVATVKSPLSRMTTADEEEARLKEDDATPRPSSPVSAGLSSLQIQSSSPHSKDKEPISIRSCSSAALSSCADTTVENNLTESAPGDNPEA